MSRQDDFVVAVRDVLKSSDKPDNYGLLHEACNKLLRRYE